MVRHVSRLLALLMLVLHVSVAPADLRSDVDQLIFIETTEQATIGIEIIDCETGITWYDRGADLLLIPASNMKLLTSGAALDLLGPRFAFQTELVRDGDNLVLLGAGDPGLGDPDLLKEMGIGVEDLLAVWVNAAQQAQMTRIDELLIDASVFDDQAVHPTWPLADLNKRYSAEVWGLNFHLNLLNVYPKPSGPGQSPIITIEPRAPWLQIPPGGKTVTTGRNSVWLSRKYMTNEIRVHGKVRTPFEIAVQVTLHDMPTFTGRLLAGRLSEAGIPVAKVSTGQSNIPLGGGEVLTVIQTQIETVLTRCNRDSKNLYAESLLKRIGYALTGEAGSFATGAAAMRHSLLQRLGPASAKVIIADGSGLSRDNRVSAHLLAAWLVSFAQDEYLGSVLIDSLAIAGETGTLKSRFRDVALTGVVRAKSGYVSGVSCLSGYVIAPDGRVVAFSIMVNDIRGKLTVSQVKELQEGIVAAIDRKMTEAVQSEIAADPIEAAPLGG
ncbi:MAG: D-alanyl-D-alanine carboxypeptidase/D-alanyl-D-alanine-endopeptidase [Phycisphaerales bacterium]|nr:D-alanyl-D-alanine carboxypeptidase/D-alanyl-D-alanine-endopeptidase [Phycisphaerales bacterium]